MEAFIFLWFLFVVAAIAWFLFGWLRPLLRPVERRATQKIAETVSAATSNAEYSADAVRSDYGPALKSGLSAAQAWISPYFSFLGKMTRKQYALLQIIAGVAMGFVFILAGLLLDSRSNLVYALGLLMLVAALVLVCWIVLAASAKRMRDTGVTVWWVLALLVPALNLAAYAFLFLVPTDEFAGRGL